MGKFALYTIGFALLACVPAILLAGMFSGGGGDVAPFLLGMLAVGAVLAGAVCLKDKLDRMEETLKAVSKTLQEVKTELETVKGRQEVAEIKLDTVAAKLDMSRNTFIPSPQDSIWPDLRLCDTLNLYRGPYPASPPQYPA